MPEEKTKRISNHPKTVIQRDLFAQGLRKCFVCDTVQVLDNFYRNGRGSLGYTSSCKPCRMKQLKQYRKNNPEGYKR